MSFEFLIRPEAEADAREAFQWYEEQMPGLGGSFLSELDRVFDSLSASPEAHARVHMGIRRALLRRFPYGIFYLVEAGRIVVLAILHTSRDPRLWTDRQAGNS